jgi:4-amino-4-deoxy-L-arabinose transferase-like glycosyltransferase
MKKSLPLLVILIIAGIFRLYQLGVVPVGLTWDEAAIGYNAYSLLQTGRDEHGQILPIIFKSFGDYKPGLYIYLTVPSVALFGLDAFAVRLPSAIFGILAVWGIYLLVKELFARRLLALFSALALAVMPWHIHFSRGGWEVNAFTTFVIFCLYFLVRYLSQSQIKFLSLSLVFALLSMLTYQAGKLLTPLLMFVTFFIIDGRLIHHLTSFWRSRGKWLVLSILAVISIFYLVTFGGEAKNRLERLSIFNYQPGISDHDIRLDYGRFYASFFHSPVRQKFEEIGSRYLYHFSPEVLLYEGDLYTRRGHIPQFGLLNPLDFLLIFAGLYYLARHRSRGVGLVFVLLFIAPIPASLTLEEFSSVRAMFMTVPLAVIIGAGLYQITRISRLLLAIFIVPYITVLALISNVYLDHSFRYFAWEYNYGYTRTFELLSQSSPDRAVVTDIYGQPYIYYLFSHRYDPAKYQSNNTFIPGGVDVGHVFSIKNVEFRQFSLQDIALSKNTFFAGTVGNIPDNIFDRLDNIDYYEEITDRYNRVILRIVQTNP